MHKLVIIILLCCLASGVQSQKLQIYPVQLSDAKDFGGRVNCIFQDKTGFIWIGKETGLFRYDGNEMKSYRYNPADQASIGGNNILSIIEDSGGDLWIGTKGSGLNHYNRATGRFTRYLHDDQNPRSVSYNEIHAIKADGKGNLWIGTDGGGLNFFNPRSGIFQAFRSSGNDPAGLQSNKIIRINDAGRSKYWIGTWGGGLHLFDPASRKIRHMGNGTRYARSNVYCATEVSKGIVWLATWGQGLIAYDIKKNSFSPVIEPALIPNFRDLQVGANGDIWVASAIGLLYFSSASSGYRLVTGVSANYANVSRVLLDRSQIVWLGCENGSVGKINPSPKKFSVIDALYPFSNLPVNTLYADKLSGQVYFSSGNTLVRYDPFSNKFKSWQTPFSDLVSIIDMNDGNSLLCASSAGLGIFNKTTGSFKKLAFVKDAPADILGRQIMSLAAPDASGYWVGALGVAYQVTYDKKLNLGKVTRVLYSGVGGQLAVSHFPSSFLYDSKKNFWIGTWGGGLNQLKAGTTGFTSLVHNNANAKSISDNFIECLAGNRDGSTLAGTHAGLNYFNRLTASFHSVTTDDGLASDWIAAIVIDNKNRTWLSTPKGISSIAADGKKIRNYDFNDGLPANAFLPRSVSSDRTGKLYFGSSRGLVWFHPDSILDNKILPEAVLVGFKVNDEKVVVRESSPLKQSIELTKEIHLDNDQSSFSFQLAALSYFNPQKNRIKYKLNGYDKEWQLAGPDQVAAYSRVPPGRYIFSWMVSNDDGIWNLIEKNIKIVIAPSPLMSGSAIFLYALLLSGLVLFFYSRYRKIFTIIPAEIPGPKSKRGPNHDLIQPGNVETAPAEMQFLQRAILIVEENMEDPDFKVEQLCDKMFISRPQLYRKINAIAGVTVTEFIKEIRLKRAAQLILQKPGNISEIAYQVGFNDPKYFSKCFKQQFGVSPAHYTAPGERSLPLQG